MVQMLARDAAPTAPTGVVTVADLLTRYAPALPADPEPPTVPVSVGSLLRREGRAPHSADRPVQPRGRQEDDDEPDDEPRRGNQVLVRRSAIAAGALLAVGSLFGAAAVDDASSLSGDAQTLGGYPGQGRLDAQPAPAGAIPTVVDPAAASGELDPGTDAPSSWMSTAFPDTAGGGGSETTDPVGGSVEPSAVPLPSSGGDGGGPVTGDSGERSDAGPGGGASQGGGDNGSGSGPGDNANAGGGSGDGGSGGLGRTVKGVGGGVGGPVGGTVSSVGGVVDGAGDTLSDAEESDDGGLVGTIAGVAGSLL